MAQRLHPAFGDDAFGVFADHAQHADDLAGVVAQRAVGERVVGLLLVAGAFQKQQERLVPGGFAGVEHCLDPRADVVPDLRPHLARRPAECPRVFAAQRLAAVGGVAEEGQVRAPRHPHREAGGQQDVHGGAQALRPLRGWSELRRSPIDLREVRSDLVVGRERVDSGLRSRVPPSLFETHPTPPVCFVVGRLSSRYGVRRGSDAANWCAFMLVSCKDLTSIRNARTGSRCSTATSSCAPASAIAAWVANRAPVSEGVPGAGIRFGESEGRARRCALGGPAVEPAAVSVLPEPAVLHLGQQRGPPVGDDECLGNAHERRHVVPAEPDRVGDRSPRPGRRRRERLRGLPDGLRRRPAARDTSSRAAGAHRQLRS